MSKTGSVAVQVENILDEYNKRVKDTTTNAIEKTSKEAVSKLKNTSPKRSGKYARGWTVKRERGAGGIATVTVHNRVYQLTHLLENGHIVRNKKGTYGRVNGVEHIAPVEEWAASELPAEIERELR